MSRNEDTIYALALSAIPGIGVIGAKQMYEAAGSATLIYEYRHHLHDLLPDAGSRMQEAVGHFDTYLDGARREMDYVAEKGLDAYTLGDERYPARMRECADAPLVLFACGHMNLNTRHVVSMVGSRRCTAYGRDMCRAIIHDLHQLVPDLLVVSGLAYGVDINAHRAALADDVPTVAVLAHGLDRIYPAVHRSTAAQMLKQGGLLTEYTSGTTPERMNFVRRNRIVAGMADATIVVESGEKGGSLITASIAQSYGRDVFAVPGRVGDEMSLGCNNLIMRQEAQMMLTAQDLAVAMNWSTPPTTREVEPRLFVDLTDDEQRIVDILCNDESTQINTIISRTGMPYSTIINQLYELEQKGVVELLGGARYRLVAR